MIFSFSSYLSILFIISDIISLVSKSSSLEEDSSLSIISSSADTFLVFDLFKFLFGDILLKSDFKSLYVEDCPYFCSSKDLIVFFLK